MRLRRHPDPLRFPRFHLAGIVLVSFIYSPFLWVKKTPGTMARAQSVEPLPGVHIVLGSNPRMHESGMLTICAGRRSSAANSELEVSLGCRRSGQFKTKAPTSVVVVLGLGFFGVFFVFCFVLTHPLEVCNSQGFIINRKLYTYCHDSRTLSSLPEETPRALATTQLHPISSTQS